MPKHDSPSPDPAWYIFHGDRRPNPGNLLSEDLKAKLKPEDAPPWRRFDRVSARSRGARFLVSEREKARVNAALMLRRPLLITGPPGVGKTSLTYAVTHELGLAPVLRWSITSRTRLQDGLYHYDPVARLQDTPRFATEVPRPQGSRRRPIPGLDRNLDNRPPIERYLKLGPPGTAFAGFAQPEKRPFPRVLLIDEIVHAFHSAASEKDLATDQLLNVVLLVMKGIDPFEGIRPLDEHDKDSLIAALWKSLRDEHA